MSMILSCGIWLCYPMEPHGSVGMRGNVSPSQLPLRLCIVLTCDLWSVRPYDGLIRQTGVCISHRIIKWGRMNVIC